MEFNYIIKLTNVMKAINPNTELNSIVLLLLYLSVTSFLLRTQSGNPLFNELLFIYLIVLSKARRNTETFQFCPAHQAVAHYWLIVCNGSDNQISSLVEFY